MDSAKFVWIAILRMWIFCGRTQANKRQNTQKKTQKQCELRLWCSLMGFGLSFFKTWQQKEEWEEKKRSGINDANTVAYMKSHTVHTAEQTRKIYSIACILFIGRCVYYAEQSINKFKHLPFSDVAERNTLPYCKYDSNCSFFGGLTMREN